MHWGRKYWFVLETSAQQITQNERIEQARHDFKNLVYSMATMLPCSTCRDHWNELVVKPNVLTAGKLANSKVALEWVKKMRRKVTPVKPKPRNTRRANTKDFQKRKLKQRSRLRKRTRTRTSLRQKNMKAKSWVGPDGRKRFIKPCSKCKGVV